MELIQGTGEIQEYENIIVLNLTLFSARFSMQYLFISFKRNNK